MEPHGIIVPTASPVVAGIKLINQISINVVLAKKKGSEDKGHNSSNMAVYNLGFGSDFQQGKNANYAIT